MNLFGWSPYEAELPSEPEAQMKTILYRQGDVLLRKVPNGLPLHECKLDQVVLAYGEVTGHAHVIEKAKSLLTTPEGDKQAWDSAAERYIQVLEKTALKHLDLPRGGIPTGEHADIELDPGIYQVIRQREWSEEMERYVSD